MWLIVNNVLNNETILLQAGKMLCLCQKFESTCKGIVTQYLLTDPFDENKINLFSEEYFSYVDKLKKLLLGQTVTRLAKKFGDMIRAKDIEILEQGIASRNFICHDLLNDFISASFAESENDIRKKFNKSFEDVQFPLIELRGDLLNREVVIGHLRNLISADYIVSKWSYEFQEKQSGRFYDKEGYAERLIDWVFKDSEVKSEST